jgi:CRISPR-associated protein Cmr6
MARGRVQSWNGQTGFLVDEADGQRVFFGDRSLRSLAPEDVRAGMVLEFDRVQGPKGPRANNVRQSGAAAPVAPHGQGSAAPPSAPRAPAVNAITEPPAEVVLPRSVQALIHQVSLAERHPGLQLDRLSVPGNQERQRESLLDVTRSPGDRALFVEVSRRRADCLRAGSVEPWTRTTAAPLTLHLARSNALENAGLCLHPVYGFAYLPGSGLKGVARAYAETVWLPERTDNIEAGRRIETVFGTVKERQSAGAVVFHDAWPTSWPGLFVDIVNNHHPHYYQGEDAPGDWDSPNPVYFLAVPAGTAFEFALGKRRDDPDSDDLLRQARAWLDGGLTYLGVGAKTAAGYGTFLAAAGQSPSCPGRAEVTATLELITPAFLAGASQEQGDCNLRSATLRGLLRWWWRTLHAGHLTFEELRALEAALWGDTEAGGAIELRLVPTGAPSVRLYEHHPDRLGVRYLAYGMDEKSKGERRRRWSCEPGSTWVLRLRGRNTRYVARREDLRRREAGVEITAEQVLEQARAALWLLTEFGGIGSKSRKGFGSLQAVAVSGHPLDLQSCMAVAGALRLHLDLDRLFEAARAESPALSDPDRQSVAIPMPWADPVQALDAVGGAYQAVAQRFKHQAAKAAWGLPRKIHGPSNTPLSRQSRDTWQPAEWLDFPKRPRGTRPDNARHAAPIHVHLARADGGLVVRLLALPAKYLRDRAESVRMLREFVDGFRNEFSARLQAKPVPGRPGVSPRSGALLRPPASSAATTVKVLERREAGGKVSFVVQEEGRPKGMLMYGSPPATLPGVGDTIQVYRNNADPRSPQYRWDPPPPPTPAGPPPRRR